MALRTRLAVAFRPAALYCRFSKFVRRTFLNDAGDDLVDELLSNPAHRFRVANRDIDDWFCSVGIVCGVDAARLRREGAATATAGDADDDGDETDKDRQILQRLLFALSLQLRMDQIVALQRRDAVDTPAVPGDDVKATSCYFALPRVSVGGFRSLDTKTAAHIVRRVVGFEGLAEQRAMLAQLVPGEANGERRGSNDAIHPLALLVRGGVRLALGRSIVKEGAAATAASAEATASAAAPDGGTSAPTKKAGIRANKEKFASRVAVDLTDATAVENLPLGAWFFRRACAEVKTNGVELLFALDVWKVVRVPYWFDEATGQWQEPEQNTTDTNGGVVVRRLLPGRGHPDCSFGDAPVRLIGEGCGDEGLRDFDKPGAFLAHPNALPSGECIGTVEQLATGGTRWFQAVVDPGGGANACVCCAYACGVWSRFVSRCVCVRVQPCRGTCVRVIARACVHVHRAHRCNDAHGGKSAQHYQRWARQAQTWRSGRWVQRGWCGRGAGGRGRCRASRLPSTHAERGHSGTSRGSFARPRSVCRCVELRVDAVLVCRPAARCHWTCRRHCHRCCAT
jgi:hypothetical protein